MPRKHDEKPSTPPSAASSRTSALFKGRKPAERSAAMTRERIAEHMEAFQRAGGTIEVLGTTRALQRIGLPEDPPSPTPAPTPSQGRSRKSR
ncbi:hypothetical protein [Thermomonas hydrothermalis]|uniref:Uncharacterized protein n=1 Tax=Thermomonas hydrothermalis TaxID=213588 RepID=A0A1M4V7P0_9GAMM|nr:hypothetical protein [Thermomonas hydrothermalis]SHE64868.1 hypothetical protein SAMN02745204_00855 [Thermomonas hydrothermalis]